MEGAEGVSAFGDFLKEPRVEVAGVVDEPNVDVTTMGERGPAARRDRRGPSNLPEHALLPGLSAHALERKIDP